MSFDPEVVEKLLRTEENLEYPEENNYLDGIEQIPQVNEDYLLEKEIKENFVIVQNVNKKRNTFSHFPTEQERLVEEKHISLATNFKLPKAFQDKNFLRILLEIFLFPLIILLVLFRKLKVLF